MSIDIYELLKSNYSELCSICNDINNLVFTSPHSVIIKSRIFAEQITKEIAKLEDMEELSDLNLAERLRTLRFNGIIEKEIDEYFYEIRKIGNKGAHEEVEDEIVSALKVHRAVYKITGWFIETYIDYNFKTPLYKNPKPAINNVSETQNSNMIAKLVEKVEKVANILNIHKENKIYNIDYENIIDKEEKALMQTEVCGGTEECFEETKIDSINIIESKCLIDELGKLKESSKEAVEGLNVFTPFKKYMHVDRNAQEN